MGNLLSIAFTISQCSLNSTLQNNFSPVKRPPIVRSQSRNIKARKGNMHMPLSDEYDPILPHLKLSVRKPRDSKNQWRANRCSSWRKPTKHIISPRGGKSNGGCRSVLTNYEADELGKKKERRKLNAEDCLSKSSKMTVSGTISLNADTASNSVLSSGSHNQTRKKY